MTMYASRGVRQYVCVQAQGVFFLQNPQVPLCVPQNQKKKNELLYDEVYSSISCQTTQRMDYYREHFYVTGGTCLNPFICKHSNKNEKGKIFNRYAYLKTRNNKRIKYFVMR